MADLKSAASRRAAYKNITEQEIAIHNFAVNNNQSKNEYSCNYPSNKWHIKYWFLFSIFVLFIEYEWPFIVIKITDYEFIKFTRAFFLLRCWKHLVKFPRKIVTGHKILPFMLNSAFKRCFQSYQFLKRIPNPKRIYQSSNQRKQGILCTCICC